LRTVYHCPCSFRYVVNPCYSENIVYTYFGNLFRLRVKDYIAGGLFLNYLYTRAHNNLCILLYSSSFPLEHRALTTSFHLSRSLAAVFASSQVMLMVFNSACRGLFQVKHGLPLLRCPCGSQFKAWRVMLVCSRRMVCPIHLHFLFWMVSVMGSCPVLCQSSWLEMRSGHLMRRI